MTGNHAVTNLLKATAVSLGRVVRIRGEHAAHRDTSVITALVVPGVSNQVRACSASADLLRDLIAGMGYGSV